MCADEIDTIYDLAATQDVSCKLHHLSYAKKVLVF